MTKTAQEFSVAIGENCEFRYVEANGRFRLMVERDGQIELEWPAKIPTRAALDEVFTEFGPTYAAKRNYAPDSENYVKVLTAVERLKSKLEGLTDIRADVSSHRIEAAMFEAEKILLSDDPLEEIGKHLDHLMAGERENKSAIFTLLLSGKVSDPSQKQIIIIKGTEGSGKTTLMRLADPFNVKDVGRFSQHALDYSNLENYEVLRLKEIGHMDQEGQGISTLKFLSSDDRGYTVEIASKDKESGRWKTEQYKIPPITVISSTTRITLDGQFERRAWTFNPDESIKQTDEVLKHKELKAKEDAEVKLGLREETSTEFSRQVVGEVLRTVEPFDVVVPYVEGLKEIFSLKPLRIRGDWDKIHSLIQLATILRQKTLPIVLVANGEKGRKVIFSTVGLGIKILATVREPLTSMLLGLEKRTRDLLSILREMSITNAGAMISKGDRDKVAKKMHRSEKYVRVCFNEWVEAGYASVEEETGRGKPKTHILLVNLNDIEQHASSLITDTKLTNDFGHTLAQHAEKFLADILPKLISVEEKVKTDIAKTVLGAYSTGNLISEKVGTQNEELKTRDSEEFQEHPRKSLEDSGISFPEQSSKMRDVSGNQGLGDIPCLLGEVVEA